MNDTLPGQPVGKPIGFKTLQEITGYISIHDGNVIRVTVTVMKVIKTDQKAPDGYPVYNMQTGLNMIAMSKDDYSVVVKNDLAE